MKLFDYASDHESFDSQGYSVDRYLNVGIFRRFNLIQLRASYDTYFQTAPYLSLCFNDGAVLSVDLGGFGASACLDLGAYRKRDLEVWQ